VTEPPPCSHSAAHGRLAASVPDPPASADEWPLVPGRSSELLPASPVQGSAVAPAAPMADGRSRADPEDVLPLSAASGSVPVPLASADEWPLVSWRSSEVPPASLVRGSGVPEARAVPEEDGRSRADPKDVLTLPPAASLAQALAHALPASPMAAASSRTPPHGELAERRPGQPAPAAAGAAPPAVRSARAANARNPVHREDGRAWVAAGSR